MVCPACVTFVTNIVKDTGLEILSIELGKVVVKSQKVDTQNFREKLLSSGFDIIEDNNVKKLQAIKNTIIETLFYNKNDTKYRMSEILSSKIGLSYSTLSKLFVSQENKTIEQYTIELRIEKVKELLSYNELPLKVIAKDLNYSSIQALSNQFKKVTGMTVSEFKKEGKW